MNGICVMLSNNPTHICNDTVTIISTQSINIVDKDKIISLEVITRFVCGKTRYNH